MIVLVEPIEIVVDALDESLSYTGQVTIADLLSRLESLSPQVRFIVTSRPNQKLDGPFSKAKPFYLSGRDRQTSNRQDIDAFLESRFKQDPKLLAKIAGWTEENLKTLLTDIGNKAAHRTSTKPVNPGLNFNWPSPTSNPFHIHHARTNDAQNAPTHRFDFW